MVRFSQLRGQRVLTREGAQLVGSVRRLLLDQRRMTVNAVELEGVLGDATVLPWSEVAAVGIDALMIDSSAALQVPSAELLDSISAGAFDLEGKHVLSELGDSLGRLQDIEFDEASGRVTGVSLPGHRLPTPTHIAVGAENIILPASR